MTTATEPLEKTAEQLRSEYEALKKRAKKDVKDLNSGRPETQRSVFSAFVRILTGKAH